MLRAFLILVLTLLTALPAHGAPKPRPYSGIGILIIHPFIPQRGADTAAIPIYQDPGVRRFAEMEGSEFPPLAPVLKTGEGKYAAVVTERREGWLRVVYDDAGREGWLQKERYWEYAEWEHFLRGRRIQLLPGLKKGLYALRKEPADASPATDSLSPRRDLRVIEVKGDWCLVIVDLTAAGWLRWRDSDGRFLIGVDEKFNPQKH